MQNFHKQVGISLTEVLVAAILIGLTILAISPMMGYGFRATHLTKERSSAVQAGQRLVEEIQDAGFSQAANLVSISSPSAIATDDLSGNKFYISGDGSLSNSPQTGAKLLQVQRIYNYVVNDPQTMADDLIQVTVKLTWPGSGGQNVTMGISLSRDLN